MSVPIFSPPQGPSYPLEIEQVFPVDSYATNSGLEVARPLGQLLIRRMRLQWTRMAVPTRDYIQSFLEALAGTNGPIQYTPPDAIASPTGTSPTLTQAAGGSLSGRSYDVQFSWWSTQTTQETAPSGTATLALDANKLITVAVPPAPNGVDGFRVYADDGSTSGLQATVTAGRTWTEPSGGLISGASAPSSSTLKPPIKWTIDQTSTFRLVAASRWSFEMTLLEQLI